MLEEINYCFDQRKNDCYHLEGCLVNYENCDDFTNNVVHGGAVERFRGLLQVNFLEITLFLLGEGI